MSEEAVGGKRSKRRRAEPTLKFHPLFPPAENHDEEEQAQYTEDKIFEIMIGRFDTDGKFRCALRRYLPSELRDLRAIHEAHGGGVYDLMAVNQENRMVRKTRWTIEGAPRSLNGVDAPQETAKPQGLPTMPAAAPNDPNGQMLALMGTIIVASMQQTGQIMAALVAGQGAKVPTVDPMSYVAPVLEAVAKLQPQPPQVVPTAIPQTDPIQQMRNLYALQKEIAQPESKEESTAEVIAQVVPAVGQVIGSILANRAPPVLSPAG